MSVSKLCFAVSLALASFSVSVAEDIEPVAKAHAHNDYYHDRPLLDALDHGFCSVEADVYLVDGKLLVAHSRNEIKPENTLQKLYLEPLRQRVTANDGRVFPDVETITLLVDIKSRGTATYETLHQLLESYAEILTSVTDEKLASGAVQVVVSGNRDWDAIAKSNPRYVGVDGRLSDLDSELPSDLLPMISDNWGVHFKWRGDGPFPDEERQKLLDVVRKSHAAGRRVRLWATPESEAVWKALLEADVDHINTDQLERLSKFLRQQRPSP